MGIIPDPSSIFCAETFIFVSCSFVDINEMGDVGSVDEMVEETGIVEGEEGTL